MSSWNEYRLVDILSRIDLSLLEGNFPEEDLENPELFEEEKQKKSRVRIALISGLAASSVAVAGVIVFFCRKHEVLRKAA
ncbi:MAG: hypothetical protein Q4C59_06450 [Lachnospiraceae bacterium]|nr:hypothetical protein [Lachnospiraceae bacterium]